MTSNELNEILNKTRRTKEISLTPEQVEELVNKLEVLEIFKLHFQKVTFINKLKAMKGEKRIRLIEMPGKYCLGGFINDFNDTEKEKIEDWLDGKD